MTDRTTFLAERLTGIGGSDIASLFNLEPWGCARKLMYEKLEVQPDYEPQSKWVFERGHIMEPVILRKFFEKTGIEIEPVGIQRNRAYPWAFVHPDGMDREHNIILEAKCLNRAYFKKTQREGLPDAYILQIHYAASLTQARKAYFAIFNYDTGELHYWDVDLKSAEHDRLLSQIIAAAEEFWAMKTEGRLPDKLHPDCEQCHDCPWRRTCQGDPVFNTARKKGLVTFDRTLAALANKYNEAKRQEDIVKAMVAETKQELSEAVGDREAVETTGFKIVYPQIDGRESIDAKLLETYLIRKEGDKAGEVLKGLTKRGKPYRMLRLYQDSSL